MHSHQHSQSTTTVRRLALSRAVSNTFSEAAHIALVALVFERTHSTRWVAAVMFAGVVTYAIAAPFAGLAGDRFDRRRVLVCSELGAAACFVLLAFAHGPWQILALVVANAACVVSIGPALDAAIPNVVDDDRLEWANAMIGSARTAAQLVGPLLGGALVAVVGPAVAFGANAASFVVSVTIVLTTRCAFQEARSPHGAREEDHGLTAGVRFIAGDPVLRTLASSWSFVLVGFGVVTVAELPLAQTFGMGSFGYGAIASSWAVGSLVGTVAARRSSLGSGGVRTLGWTTVLVALAMGTVALTPWFTPVVLAMACGGFAMAIAGIVDCSLMQQRTPDAVRSRVRAADQAICTTSFGLAMGAGGFLLSQIGVRGAYAIAVVTCALAASRFLASARSHERVHANDVSTEDTKAPVAA